MFVYSLACVVATIAVAIVVVVAVDIGVQDYVGVEDDVDVDVDVDVNVTVAVDIAVAVDDESIPLIMLLDNFNRRLAMGFLIELFLRHHATGQSQSTQAYHFQNRFLFIEL